MREGGLAPGATKWQTIRTVILPSALPGLVTGLILSAGKIIRKVARSGHISFEGRPYFISEELITELMKAYTIVIVTHNMQQAARVSQYTGFFLSGRLIEYGPTVGIFEQPKRKETGDYISGRFG